MFNFKSLKPITLLLSLFSVSLCSCANTNINKNNKFENEMQVASDDVSVYQLASFLINKNGHYPISDEFIEKYQQNGGGYIDYATSLGMEVNRLKHLPDQKFHFFDSWYIRSIQDNSLTYTDSAKSRVYVGIKCPELLLWIFEACEASPSKVRKAMKVAEQGKVNKEHISTTAKKMREQVLWEDLHINTTFKMANNVTFSNTVYDVRVAENIEINANVDPINTTDKASWSINKGNDIIDIIPNGNKCKIIGKKEGKAEISVSYNKYATSMVNINVLPASKPMIMNVPNVIDLDINKQYSLNPQLNIGEGTFTYSDYDESIIKITNGQVVALKNGTTNIHIVCNENNTLTKDVKIDCFNHGTKLAPLSVYKGIEIANKYCINESDTLKTPIYIKGIISNINENKTAFTLKDETNNSLSLNIENIPTNTLSNNDIATLSGIISLKNNELLMNKNINIIEVNKGKSLVEFVLDEFVEVYQNDIKIIEPLTLQNGTDFTFKVINSNNRIVKEILINGKELTLNKENIYTIIIDGDTKISINTLDPNAPDKYSYDINYDLGTRKTAKLLETNDELFNVFKTSNTKSIINSVTSFNYIYGGGNGGRSDTRWYQGNMIKLGTTKVTGDFTLNLNEKVNKIIIKGYATNTSCKLRIGDAASTDWTGTLDNKTVLFDCGSMTLSNKANVEGNLASSLEINFPSTSNLKISTSIAEPIYITAIELYVAR